jgi:two-component system cell cycle response regulator
MKTMHLRVLVGDPGAPSQLPALLEGWDCAVECARDGASVVKRLTSGETPDVVLLDADLPPDGGIEVIREARFRAPQLMVWAILMSGAPDRHQVLAAKDAGVDDVLLKPVDASDLFLRLHTAKRVQALHAELRERIEAVRFHATHDGLTGLWNRESTLRMLFQETDRVLRMRTPLCLLLLDLDQFTQVNLDYGYAMGDKILKQLAARLRRYLRSYDLVGRFGEDEFLIGLPGCPGSQARDMAERLQKHVLGKPFDTGSTLLMLHCSVGVACSHGRSPVVVLREAERALAEAKLAGRNRVSVFTGVPALSSQPQPLQLPG